MPTIKQEWSRERNWQMYGSLAGCIQRLKQIAYSHSIVSIEKFDIDKAINHLESVRDNWKDEGRKSASFLIFQARRKVSK